MPKSRLRTRELRSLAARACIRRDPDAVHELRRTASRLAARLALGGQRVLRDDLRWLRRSVAEARDLDVLLARDDVEPSLAAWLEREREAEQGRLVERLDLARSEALAEALERLPDPDDDAARRALAELSRRARHAGDDFARTTGADETVRVSAHRLRRRLRRLRHALEWSDVHCEPVRVAQDDLGRVCDDALLARTLERARSSGLSVEPACHLERAIEAGLERARGRWPALRAHLTALASTDGPWPDDGGR
ncbi:MAG: CHAD domain-containing protein [Planctomycetes bacterium]|nr:CHAD domain-containing protein [Planctomycetota bacterium]